MSKAIDQFAAERQCPICRGRGVVRYLSGASMRKLREASGLSMRKVALRMGISAPYLGDLELGRRNVSRKLAASFLAALEGEQQ